MLGLWKQNIVKLYDGQRLQENTIEPEVKIDADRLGEPILKKEGARGN